VDSIFNAVALIAASGGARLPALANKRSLYNFAFASGHDFRRADGQNLKRVLALVFGS